MDTQEYREREKARQKEYRRIFRETASEEEKEKYRKKALEKYYKLTPEQREKRNAIRRATRKFKETKEYKMWWSAKVRSKKSGLDFNIEISDIIIPEYCPLLKIKINFDNLVGKKDSPSLDCIDNSKGYIKGNIQVISKLANAMKNSASKDELITFANSVLDMYGKL